jgi:PST family polysaccharide transporter
LSKLKKEFIRGVSWSLLGQFINQGFSFVVTVVLARLLAPAEFGAVAMVTVLTGFARTLVDFGFGNALIYKKDITETDKSSVFWINLAVSVILTILYVLMSGVIARFYNEAELQRITIVLSSLFVINSMSIVNSSMLRKDLNFKTGFKISLIAQLVSGIAAVLIAVYGFSYWAIVFEMLIGSIISTCLGFYFVRWFPKFIFSIHSLKELFRFGWGLVGNNTLNYWVRNIDNLLIGKFIGPAELGLYSKSYSFLTLPMKNVSDVVSRVLFPSLSQLRETPERIKSVYFKVCKTIMLLIAPLMMFIFVEADMLIALIFGQKWMTMLPIVRVFCILAINQSIGTLIANLYMAHGKTKEMFYLGTLLRIMLIGSIVIGLNWGILGVALCYTVASYISSFIQHSYMGRVSGFTVTELMATLSPILTVNVLLGGVLLALRYLFFDFMNVYVLLGLSTLAYGSLYILSLSLLKEEAFIEIKKIAYQFFKSSWQF